MGVNVGRDELLVAGAVVASLGALGIGALVKGAHHGGNSDGGYGGGVRSDVASYTGTRVTECHDLGVKITDYRSGRRVTVYECSVGDGYGDFEAQCFTDVDGWVEDVSGGQCN
jgi:hypothetical protein